MIPDKSKVGEIKELLKLKSTPNGGVAVTNDLKYTSKFKRLEVNSASLRRFSLVKYSRQNGIHVSPTALWDGLVANEISSSWGEKEWSEFLAEKVTV